MSVHLNVESGYSIMDSTIKIDQLVKRAALYEFKALVLTDEHVLYGVIPFYKSCLKHGLKPIIGLNIIVSYKNETLERLTLLAKNREGYDSILQLSTNIQLHRQSVVTIDTLKEYSAGVIAILHISEESLGEMIRNENFLKPKEYIDKLRNFYLEKDFYLGINKDVFRFENTYIEQLQAFMEFSKIGAVAATNVKYLDTDDHEAFSCLQAIDQGIKWSPEDVLEEETLANHLYSKRELENIYQFWPELLAETDYIAERCNLEIDFTNQMLPSFPLPEGITTGNYLKELCYDQVKVKYNFNDENVVKRLEYELKTIDDMKFNDYFLIVWDFIRYARESNIVVGPGRGSAAGSLVAYLLGITNVDPLQHELLFERFLNPERVTMPDIDIDFSDERRDEVIEYVREKYGETHVSQIITFGTFAARSLIRELTKTMDIDQDTLNFILKQMPSGRPLSIVEYVKQSKELNDFIRQNEKLQAFFRIAVKLEGLPRHISTHAAGVVISKDPLISHVPLTKGSNETNLTQFAMNELESIGLLKMDFLGLKNLTLIERILKSIQSATGRFIDLDKIPINDPKTFELLREGRTNGVFQLESSGMKKVLQDLEPSEFNDIVAVNALYRPGPMEYISTYINRKKKKEEVVLPHPDLNDILESTYGVLIYQEQIMQIAHKIAGFTLGQADILRRAVSKKQEQLLKETEYDFLIGCKQNGYKEEVGTEIFNWIVKFANYGFNKSHAVAYSKISYELAYLKANFPLSFYTEMLNSTLGDHTKINQYMREAKQLEIEVIGPSIQRSFGVYTVSNSKIQMGLSTIKGVGQQSIKEIVRVRKLGSFKNLFDFCLRINYSNLNRVTLENLIRAGAFDELYGNRATLLGSIDLALDQGELFKEYKDQPSFFQNQLEAEYIQLDDFSEMKKLRDEKELMGLYLSSHPIKKHEKRLHQEGYLNTKSVIKHIGKKNIKIVAIIETIRVIRTKNGESMAFITLNDSSGELDAVIFPSVYREENLWLEEEKMVEIQGNIDERQMKTQLIVNNIKPFEEEQFNIQKNRLFIKLDDSIVEIEALKKLKEIVRIYKGNTTIIIHNAETKETYQLQNEYKIEVTDESLNALIHIFGEGCVVYK